MKKVLLISLVAGTFLFGFGEKHPVGIHSDSLPIQFQLNCIKQIKDNNLIALNDFEEDMDILSQIKQTMEEESKIFVKKMNTLMKDLVKKIGKINKKDTSIKIDKTLSFTINQQKIISILSSLKEGEKKLLISENIENKAIKIYVEKNKGLIKFIVEESLR